MINHSSFSLLSDLLAARERVHSHGAGRDQPHGHRVRVGHAGQLLHAPHRDRDVLHRPRRRTLLRKRQALCDGQLCQNFYSLIKDAKEYFDICNTESRSSPDGKFIKKNILYRIFRCMLKIKLGHLLLSS